MKELKDLVRPNVWNLKPYSSARKEYAGNDASIFLDANENPYNAPNNRYPDPLQKDLKKRIATIKSVRPEQIYLGNGSDESIDMLFRVFCRPGVDNVVAIAPTYGMYEVCAEVNDIEYRKVLLDASFQFKASDLLDACDDFTKLIFLCSPNNPTGNDLNAEEIIRLVSQFQGIVVLDEAYIDFSDTPSFIRYLGEFPNLVILQTFSKAWGCAAIRLGMAFASESIVELMNKIKYPYNINLLTQREALDMVGRYYRVQEWVESLLGERKRLMNEFKKLPCCKQVYPSDANFFLVRVGEARKLYAYLVEKGIVVRNRTNIVLCRHCLRITVGTRPENDRLLEVLKEYRE